MKNFFLPVFALLISSLATAAFTFKNTDPEPAKVKWLTWKEAYLE